MKMFLNPLKKALLATTLVVLGSSSLRAENVFVTSYKGNTTTTDVTPSPFFTFTGTVSASGSSSFSSASPSPGVSPRRSRFGTTSGASFSVQPGDNVPFGFYPLQSPGVYKIYVTMPTSGTTPADIVVNMTASGGDLSDSNGVAGVSIPLPWFRTAAPINQWLPAGFITNNTPNPTITFTHASGGFNRFYMDAVRFENVGDPCYGVVGSVSVVGPLAAAQTAVTVTGITNGATNITIFVLGNPTPIGQTNYAPGFANGAVNVPTTALTKSSQILATQTKNGCTSQLPLSGPIVGGGPNTSLRAFVSCWKNSTNAGPIGANSAAPTSGFPYFLGATGFQFGFGTAPVGGRTLTPDACWQLISFQNGSGADDAIDMNSGGHVTNNDTFCSLEGLVFSINDTDTGPYDIYIDQIMNGDTVVEDFESYTVETTNMFVAPNVAASPAPSTTYLTPTNSSLISSVHAFDGTKACRIQWQWKDESNTRWAHVIANATAGKRYPQLNSSKPITARVLVLPVGTSIAHVFNGTVSTITNAAPPVYSSTTNTFGVTVTGSGPFTYQWTWSGGSLPNASTDRTYTIDGGGAGLSSADNGTYTVQVSDGTCTETRSIAFTAADPLPTITNQPSNAIIVAGNTAGVMTVGATGHLPSGYPLTYQWRANGNDIIDQTQSTLWITNASLADVVDYDVVVANSFGSTTSSIARLSVTTVAPGTGAGLRGEYRTVRLAADPFTGPISLVRTDAVVHFNFGAGSPDPSISADNFTTRWTGEVQALGDDTYTFVTRSDDGVRLWVNGQLLINKWQPQGATSWTNTIALSGNQKYPLVLEYYEAAVSASVELNWFSASGSIPYTTVPQSQLYPAGATTPAVPTLTTGQPDATHLVFSWGGIGTYTLTYATNVLGPYTNIIGGVVSPYTNVIGTEPQKYFRLQAQ